MVDAIIKALPFPIAELSFEKLPDVLRITGYSFEAGVDLVKTVLGGQVPDDVEPWHQILSLKFWLISFVKKHEISIVMYNL